MCICKSYVTFERNRKIITIWLCRGCTLIITGWTQHMADKRAAKTGKK